MAEDTLKQIFEYVDQHFDDHLAATQRYLRQPSISTENLGIQKCAEMTAEMLRDLGADARLVPLKGGHPAVRALRRLDAEPGVVPILPGTAPQVLFSEPPLNMPFVMSGLGHGWLLHAPNEYFEVEGLRACEKLAVALLYEFADA